jgi:hypothetical protein
MAFVVPGLAAEVAQLPANGGKAGDAFSYRERALLKSVKEYVDALPAGSITLAELSSGIAPSHVVKFAGKHTAVGASATQTVTVTGALATDIVMATVQTRAGAGVAYILRATPSADTVTIVGSAAFDNGDIISYSVLRAAS